MPTTIWRDSTPATRTSTAGSAATLSPLNRWTQLERSSRRRAGQVVGYFSLTMGSVLRQDAPAKLVRGLPAYPVGMVLLARLAVDRRCSRAEVSEQGS